MAMNLNFSSAPVQTHAVRTAPVRGSAGDMSSYKFSEYVQASITEHYVHVPEVDMTAIAAGTSDLNYIRRIGSFRAVCEAAGGVSDFYLISPSFISDTVTEGLVTQGGAIYGGHSETFSDDTYGSITDHLIYKVAGCNCVANSDFTVPKSAITYNGYPVLRPDSGCCVYGGFDASLRFGDDRNLWPDWVDNGASGGDGSGNITVPGTDGGFKPGGGTGSGGSGSTGGSGSEGGTGSEDPITPPTQTPGTGTDASGNPVVIATPTVTYPVWDQEFASGSLEVQSSTFSTLQGSTEQDGVEYQIELEDGTPVYSVVYKNTTKFGRVSIEVPKLGKRTTVYIKCRHDSVNTSWTKWSERVRVVVFKNLKDGWLTLPSGREIKRHESNLGTVLRYYAPDGKKNVLIFDIKYQFGTSAEVVFPSLTMPSVNLQGLISWDDGKVYSDSAINAVATATSRRTDSAWISFMESILPSMHTDIQGLRPEICDYHTMYRYFSEIKDIIKLDMTKMTDPAMQALSQNRTFYTQVYSPPYSTSVKSYGNKLRLYNGSFVVSWHGEQITAKLLSPWTLAIPVLFLPDDYN